MPGLSFPNLPDNGVCRYGSWVFPALTSTEEIDIRPEYDSARRTVIYNVISFTLRSHLTGRQIDLASRAVAQVLTKPAQPLVYSGKGYGFVVNVGGVRDVLWGPLPKNVKLKPLGGGNAAILTWSVSCAIPDGAGARFQFAPMEFNFTVDYDHDESGLATRTMTGFLRIPMTRATPLDRRLPDNIDSYREDICPPVIEGFRRKVPGRFTLSEGKDRLDFLFVDEQFPGANVPPVGCVEAAGSHRMSCPPGKLTLWNHVVSCSYELARNGAATVANARNAFFALVADRVKASLDELDRNQPQLSSGGTKRATAVPLAFSMSEDIYGKPKVDFSLSYKIAGPDLPAMIQASGMFRPVPGSNWKLWWASVSNVLGPRGQAGLVFSITDDKIVDLLQPAPLATDLSNRRRGTPAAAGRIPGGIFPEPTPENSWLDWRMRVYQETDSGVVEVRTLPTEPRTERGDMYGGGAGTAAASAVGAGVSLALGNIAGLFPAVFPGGKPSDFFFPPPRNPGQRKAGGTNVAQEPQRRARQASVIYLVGSALRVKYPIQAPALTKWGDATLVPANRLEMGEGFWTEVVGNAIWPIHAAAWNLRWVCTYPPSDTPPTPPSPVLGGGGQAPIPPNAGDFIPAGETRVPYGLPSNPT